MAVTRDTQGTQHYEGYQNDRTYTQFTGTLVLPCADGEPVVSRVHQDYGVVQRTFAATKNGAPPLLPKPAANETLLSSVTHLPLPIPIQDGTGSGWKYTATGVQEILETEPSTPGTGFDYGRWPFRTAMDDLAENAGFTGPIHPPVINAELVTMPFYPIQLENPDFYWPQALCITTGFFTADI